MSYIVRRAALNTSPLRSIQCTRIVPPIVMQHITLPSRRNYAAHQAEESYDAFNERYSSTIASDLFFQFILINWLTCACVGMRNSFLGQTINSKFNVD
jgi:hypothetical protein